jgi:hypothetical protein
MYVSQVESGDVASRMARLVGDMREEEGLPRGGVQVRDQLSKDNNQYSGGETQACFETGRAKSELRLS